jgi:glucokinase
VSAFIGVDVGGTKVATARLDENGLGQEFRQPTVLNDTGRLVDEFVELVEQAAEGHSYDAVGVGVPSIVRFATGEAVSTANIPSLVGAPLRDMLSERLGVPVFVDNDATVAAWAEAHDHDFKLVCRNLVMITVGTGIGGGIIINGHIFRGASGGAGEIGHALIGVVTEPDIPFAGGTFPEPGSLEALAAGRALDRLAGAPAASKPGSALGRAAAAGERVDGQAATAMAAAGDPDAQTIVRRWAHALGIGIANAINTFDPEEVVIGGGGAAAGDLLLEPAKAIAEGYVLPGLRGLARVRRARFGPEAGVLGAALLARDELRR